MRDEKRTMRRKYLLFGLVLLVLVAFSLCISDGYYGKIYYPVEVVQCYAAWFEVTGAQLFDPLNADRVYFAVMERLPMYNDVIYTVLSVFKYVGCGVLLAVSGMLYQNTFRNPIAAPSMLGVTGGINAALLVLVLQFGYGATQQMGMYYLYCYIGGALVLGLVLLGGKYMSGKGEFNVVNMLLIGTIVSQLLGVIVTYVQNMVLDEAAWDAFRLLQTATGLDTGYTYASLLIGGIVALVPVIAFRFRLNLVAFDDAEMRLLGVNADALRVLALVCGSIMILTAQVNAGQVAMVSLVIPFVVRAVFGSEFRKQLIGNVLCGAIVLLIAGDLVSYIAINEVNLDIGSVVTICAMPLFVWMVARGQRTWE